MELRNVRELRRMERAITLGWLLGAGRIYFCRVPAVDEGLGGCPMHSRVGIHSCRFTARRDRQSGSEEILQWNALSIIDNVLRFMWYI